jgi:hypothetical protein
MSYVVTLIGALALGVYSAVRLHYYSILASRTTSDWLRLVLYIPAIALFVFAPMIGCMFLLGAGPNSSSKEMRGLAWGGFPLLDRSGLGVHHQKLESAPPAVAELFSR